MFTLCALIAWALPQSKEATKLAQRIAMAEEQFDQGLRKLTAASKQLASLKRQVICRPCGLGSGSCQHDSSWLRGCFHGHHNLRRRVNPIDLRSS